jgi:viroplasmin and RNaseH domain-containing protein
LTDIPQDGILSPLLSNIILNELDNYLVLQKTITNKGIKFKINSEYLKINFKKEQAIKKRNIKKIFLYKKKLLKLNYYNEIDSEFKKLVYVRYANEFIVGFKGSYKEACRVATNIHSFFQKELNLNLNFQVLSLFKNSIKFLGTTINLNFFYIQPFQLHTNK